MSVVVLVDDSRRSKQRLDFVPMQAATEEDADEEEQGEEKSQTEREPYGYSR